MVGLPERPVRGVVFQDVALTGGAPLTVRHAEVALRGKAALVPEPVLEAGGKVVGP